MKTKDDFSCGVVPVKEIDGMMNVFLIHQISWRGDAYWTLPKGHPEGNETPEEAARRELYEETGLHLAELDTMRTFDQAYTFVHEGVRIEKKVSYFIGHISHEDFVTQDAEVKDAGWFTFAQAKEKVTHDITRQLLGEVEETLS